jgi:general secretion pathway protein D
MRTMRSTPTNHGSRSNSDRGWRHRFRASIAPLAVAAGATVATHAADLPAPAGPAADAAAARKVIDEAARRAAAGGGPAAPVQAAPVQDGPAQVAPAGRVPDDILLAGVSAEVAAKQLEAKRLAQKSPGDAIALLDGTAAYVEAQPIPADKKEQFARRIERARRDIEEAAGKRRAELALERKAAEVEGRVERDRAQKVEVDQRIALLVDEYNTLVDQRRFAEAETVAKRAGQLAPDNIVVRQMLLQSKTIARIDRQGAIGAAQQDGVLDVLADVERAGTPFTGPIEFPVTKDWEQLTKSRQRLKAEGKGRATPAELAIHRKLDTKVTTDYRNQPLSAVLKSLQDQAGVNIHLDMVGLDLEKVGSDTPVTLALDQQITLRSVLKLLLEPLHLRYVVQDEVLKVTSPELVKGVVYPVTYQVGDLVKPIPNFSADGLGIEGALMKGYDMALRNQLQVSVEPPADALNRAARSSAGVPAGSLAQIQGRGGRGPVSGMPAAVPFGPPNVGGGGQADFQSLIDLITNTVGGPGVWADQGGNGQIRPLDISLSIVVLQTQEIHEQIADLLDQLRRLQDLQVTIEVRFISLNDTFFERIGVDFDFNIQTGVNEPLNMTAVPTQGGGSSSPGQYGINVAPGGRSQLVGLGQQGVPGVALNPNAIVQPAPGANQPQGPQFSRQNNNISNFYSVPFRQGSFNAARVPQFPGLPSVADSAASFGFAILSDIEAFFLIEAAQGNTRSNVLQAPKVTLFNGQNAFVSDTRQRPFVTSVTPVVGEFAAAQQPVITVLNEGTAVNVEAVVSNDRRFVRLTLVPFFSQIGRIEEFQFEGSKSSRAKSSDEKSGAEVKAPGATGLVGLTNGFSSSGEIEQRSNGTTLQLPEFLFTTVTTTVSVPDGGTVLLGGVKRLREGRNEYGVPILSKVPYVNRLFKNVGLGRTTDSLMLMVTPRIIIQEEEEERLLGDAKP